MNEIKCDAEDCGKQPVCLTLWQGFPYTFCKEHYDAYRMLAIRDKAPVPSNPKPITEQNRKEVLVIRKMFCQLQDRLNKLVPN